MKKRSKKKVVAILMFIAILIALFPDVQSDTFDDKPPPDYGVYNALEGVQDQKNSRINSPEILNATQDRFDNITIISGEERLDLESRRDVVTPNIPVPDMLDIYYDMWEWDHANDSEIINWILPPSTPLNYYIFSKYITNTSVTKRWTNASLRPTLGINLGQIEPNFDRWWDVDVDYDGVDDIQVFFDPITEAGNLGNLDLGELIQVLQNWRDTGKIDIGITLYYNLRKLNDALFSSPDFKSLEVYVAKSISYAGQNFILFIGLSLTNMVTELDCSVTVNTVSLESGNFYNEIQNILDQILPPPLGQGIPPSQVTLNITYADIANLSGPYDIEWTSHNEVLSSFGLNVASAKLRFLDEEEEEKPYEFLNRSWVDVDFIRTSESEYDHTVPTDAMLWLDADDDLSSFDKIEWIARDDIVCDAKVKFFDEQENVTYAEIEIDNLPRRVIMYMTVEEEGDENITVIDYWATSTVNYMDVHHYEFFDTVYENITAQRIASGDIEYVHLFLNMTRIPELLYLKGVFYLEEIEETPNINLGFGIVANFMETLTHRVTSRFTRIAKTFSSIPYRLLSIAEEGSFATVDTFYDSTQDEIGEIEFIFTSGDYATVYDENENYFAFYNNTRQSQYPVAQISLSGRITDIRYFNSSFEEDAFAEVRMMRNQQFRGIYADDINSLNAEMIISNVPSHITIFKSADTLRYNGDKIVDQLRFVSEYQNTYMDVSISNMTGFITLEFEPDRTKINTSDKQTEIGEIQFLVTTGPIIRMNGNYLLLRQETNYSMLSGRIKDVSYVDYISGWDGRLDINFAKENCLNISLLDNRSEKISADLIIDPMPKFLSVNLSGIFSTGIGEFKLPHLDTTGVLGFVNILFGIAALGNKVLTIIDEATQNALDNVGNIIEDLSFSYTSLASITLIGKILRGETFTFDDADWMHGISARQEVLGDEISMVAKLYLSGLPESGGIKTRVKGDDIFLDFSLENYFPKHDWLCVDVRGIQDRDVMLYVNEIEQGMDLNLRIGLTASLNTIPQRALGSIYMDSSKSIGSLYGRMRQTTPEISVSEIFLSNVPSNLYTAFNLSGNITIYYIADIGIEHMFVKTSRTRNDEFHDIYAILHELPKELIVSVSPVTDYDMDGSLLQSLPSLNISSAGSSLDTYIFADGKGIGQVGIVEVQVVDVASFISAGYSKGKYRVESTGIEYLWLHVMDLPLMEDHETKSVELVGKDIESFDVKVDMLFGNYPIIGIEDTDGGEVQIVLNHEMDGDRVGLALIDFKFKDGIPQSPSILINGGSMDLDEGTTHVIIPAPVLTLCLTVFG